MVLSETYYKSGWRATLMVATQKFIKLIIYYVLYMFLKEKMRSYFGMILHCLKKLALCPEYPF